MTAKTLKKERVIDCTRGLSREQRAINRRIKKRDSSLTSSCSGGPKSSSHNPQGSGTSIKPNPLSHHEKCVRRLTKQWLKHDEMQKRWQDAEDKRHTAYAARFGMLPERVVSKTPFEEKLCGHLVQPGMKFYDASGNHMQDVSSTVVSLALFDGDEMLFACSGIPLPFDTATQLDLTRIVTSACLVREFHLKRNRDDNLRVEVCLPNGNSTLGFLGLYDDDIAIVTSLGCLLVDPLDLDCYKSVPVSSDDHVIAVGRAFSSHSLWALDGVPCTECSNTWVSSTSETTKAVLGGPLIENKIDSKGRLLGMNLDLNHDHDDKRYTFLPLGSLKERLEHFQVLNPEVMDFHNYSLPEGVSRIIPSGFMREINELKALGYPLPPPLVLEFNGDLLNKFEGCFGETCAWKGYNLGHIRRVSAGVAWSRLKRNVLDKISRRVVSLASFNEGIRFFACTGLLIKLCGYTVILTSASLVRNGDKGGIDNNLKIDVFLPPNQRRSGTLAMYSLNYNIAIIRVGKRFSRACPVDVCKENQSSEKAYQGQLNANLKSSQKVIAVGRDACEGLLMGTIGEVMPTNKDSELNCEELMLSTCEINKAGIGGPLIDLCGRFIGMNFYDGRRVTPFLPKSKIVEVLIQGCFMGALPAYITREYRSPYNFDANRKIYFGCLNVDRTKEYRWPVPPPYWYHGELDVDANDIPVLMGRRQQ